MLGKPSLQRFFYQYLKQSLWSFSTGGPHGASLPVSVFTRNPSNATQLCIESEGRVCSGTDPIWKSDGACGCQVRRIRATQRAGRRRTQKPVCSVIGYTNAGKSSLVSALSGSHVEAEDRCGSCCALFKILIPSHC